MGTDGYNIELKRNLYDVCIPATAKKIVRFVLKNQKMKVRTILCLKNY